MFSISPTTITFPNCLSASRAASRVGFRGGGGQWLHEPALNLTACGKINRFGCNRTEAVCPKTLSCCKISGSCQQSEETVWCHAGKHTLRCKPQALALNCSFTRLSIIDFHGVLSFYDFQTLPAQPGAQTGGVPTAGEHLAAERKVVQH